MGIPILLSIDGSRNPIKLKWKLKNYNQNKKNQNDNKIKIEWTKLDINDYNNNGNEVTLNVGNEKGKYVFKIYYFDSNSWSIPSNTKSIKFERKQIEMKFDT